MKNSGAWAFVKKKFQVGSELINVQKTSVQVMALLEPLCLSADVYFDIRLCLEEALINAMKYGNDLKKDRPVHLEVEASPEEVRIAVRDEGKGFDFKSIEDCTKEKNLLRGSGRGVHLMHRLMDRVIYNEKGNRVLLVKSLKP